MRPLIQPPPALVAVQAGRFGDRGRLGHRILPGTMSSARMPLIFCAFPLMRLPSADLVLRLVVMTDEDSRRTPEAIPKLGPILERAKVLGVHPDALLRIERLLRLEDRTLKPFV